MSLPMNAWLQVAAAAWLFQQFAPRVAWLPGEINGPVYAVGALACLGVIVSELYPVVRSVVDRAIRRG